MLKRYSLHSSNSNNNNNNSNNNNNINNIKVVIHLKQMYEKRIKKAILGEGGGIFDISFLHG